MQLDARQTHRVHAFDLERRLDAGLDFFLRQSPFEYGARLTEMILLGCLAVKAGLGQKVEWDGAKMQCTNLPELNRHLRRDYRKGWEA